MTMHLGETHLAIVGGGPKALMALAALDNALVERPATTPLVVDLHDPGPSGAGRVWDPRQPHHLRVNLDAAKIDFSCASVPASYAEWERGNLPEAECGLAFPPRARIAEYLAWVLDCLCGSPRLRLRRRACVVESITQTDDGWVVQTPESSRTHAEVLMATGHAGTTGPDHRALARDLTTYPSGGHVAVRGAALTGIDAVLSLTAGRGGTWTRQSGSHALAYVAGGDEPGSITMVSRSGELLVPKPLKSSESMRTAVVAHTHGWPDQSDPDDAWWGVLLSAAVDAAADVGVRVDPAVLLETLDRGRDVEEPLTRWRSDLRRAEGEVDDDPAWWLGRAWALGYPDVVRSLDRAPRCRESWSRWRLRAARLERWSFGPPVDNVRRMIALADGGLMHIARVTPPGVPVVEAVITPAGVITSDAAWHEGGQVTDPLWGQLLAAGHVHVRPGERGVLTDRNATCLRPDGTRSEGLAAMGRPTEDPVIGHDTLSRTLHGDAQRWAAGLADAWSVRPAKTDHHEPTKEMAR